MLLPGNYRDITTIIHDDTPVQFGVNADGQLVYSVLVVDPTDERGRWADPKAVTFPSGFRDIGSSSTSTFDGLVPLDVPAQFVSDDKYVYMFLVFNDRNLYVARFILDIANAALTQPYEVRQRLDGTFGYRDLNGVPYLEPATRLALPVQVDTGQFAALLVPTSRPGVSRWQLFAAVEDRRVLSISIRRDDRGLFDPTDTTISYAPLDETGKPQAPESVVLPGLSSWVLELGALRVTSGLAAAQFQKHEEVSYSSAGEPAQTQMLRTEVHVLLAFCTGEGMAVLDFEVGKDGILAQSNTPVALPVLAGPPWDMRDELPDGRGLRVSTGVLGFAESADTPSILDSADGFVHLYFRGLAGEFLVCFYDTAAAAWVGQNDPLASQVKNAGDWVGDAVKTAVRDSEVLVLDSGGEYEIWRYDPLVTGVRDGRFPDQGFPGQAVLSGWGAGFFERTGGGPPVCLALVAANRVLLLDAYGSYEVWEYDASTVAGFRDGWVPGQGFPGRLVVNGTGGFYQTLIDPAPPDAVASLDQDLVFIVNKSGAYEVWRYDPTATGFRDGGRTFPGELVVHGERVGFFADRQVQPGRTRSPIVTALGQRRLLVLGEDGEYEVWEYDPATGGVHDGFPGHLVVSGVDPGFFVTPTGQSVPTAATLVGQNRILLLSGPNQYEIWEYDPTITGFRDGNRIPALGFPGTRILSGTAPGFFQERPGMGPAALASFVGYAAIDGRPSVVEQGAIATDTTSGALVKDANGNLQGFMYRWYTSRSHDTAASATRIDVADLQVAFVGTNLIDASLLGYIEGAPPLPLENMTERARYDDGGSPGYVGSTVSFNVSDKSTNVWSWDRDAGINFKSDVEAGGEVSGVKVAGKNTVETSYGWLDGREEGASYELVTTRQEVQKGYIENGHWLPYNDGMAYLLGLVADVYVLKLKGSDRIVGYQMVASDDQPAPQEVRFPLNPSYTKQGTLDGMIGNEPDADYPNAQTKRIGNSYFKPDEAKAFEDAIEREARRREAFFNQYNANAFNNLSDEQKRAMTQQSLVSTYQWQSPGGLQKIDDQVTTVEQVSAGGSFNFLGMAGVAIEVSKVVSVKATVLIGGHINLTVKKTEEAEKSFGLTVYADCDQDVLQSPPGDKVRSYNFKTFYLEQDLAHFNDFFERVVDPAWLNGQLGDLPTVGIFRGVMNRPKPAWRILHRITGIDRGEGVASREARSRSFAEQTAVSASE